MHNKRLNNKQSNGIKYNWRRVTDVEEGVHWRFLYISIDELNEEQQECKQMHCS